MAMSAPSMAIGSYSEAKKLPNGRYVKSDPTVAGGHTWRIALYPNGRLAGTTASMSLFLLLDDGAAEAKRGATADDDDVHVEFRLEMQQRRDSSPVFVSSTVAAAFSRRRNAHGFERFVSREDFEKTDLFKSGRFEIRCHLSVFPPAGSRRAAETSRSGHGQPDPREAPPPSPAPSAAATASSPPPSSVPPEPPAVPLSGLRADLGRLLATKEGADVEFEVRGKVFAAHKSVLAARSPVFNEFFFGPAKEEDTGYVRVGGDMRPEAFEALLHYAYTDSLPPATNSPEKCAALAEDLLAAADRYGLGDLKRLTENELCDHVGVSTVLPMLALAERHQCCKLKKMCLGFIGSCGNTAEVMATGGLELLARSCPSVVEDVIGEILDGRAARRRRLVNACLFAFLCFVLLRCYKAVDFF